jgi:hypothetical protein
MLKRIKPYDMPLPWNLTDDWADRLEIPAEALAHYTQLSKLELRKLELDRQLLAKYRAANLVREGNTDVELMRQVAVEIDRSWLKPEAARTPVIMGAFEVLGAYAKYHAWATQFPRHDTYPVLDTVIPYWIRGDAGVQYKYDGPGFVRITADMSDPSFGKEGDVAWGQAKIRLEELMMTAHHEKPSVYWKQFPITPFTYLNPSIARRAYNYWPGRPRYENDALGFVGMVEHLVHDSVGPLWPERQIFTGQNCHGYTSPSWIEVLIHDPQAGQIQTFLDRLSARLFECRVPKSNWQLQFEVATDLGEIKVSSVFYHPSPFGIFYKYDQQAPLIWKPTDAD